MTYTRAAYYFVSANTPKGNFDQLQFEIEIEAMVMSGPQGN
jgi:hypothetical protein